ncbi:unnamed protein product [marine sediment metagenome]|uniref:Uncharacterized protein n=1 Tax=marine sediment metagenome TaxID=412755 RepID=X0T2X6_9ZZZZ
MSTLEKILNILKMKNNPKSYSVKFYAEMKLDDGRIVATEDEQFMIGSKVFAVGDEGEAEALTAGTYTMENGNKLTIGDSSEILDLGEEAESVEEENKEEASAELSEEETELAEDDEAVVEDWAGMEKRIKNLEDAVADLKADKVEASEELSKEEEDKTEMSKEVMGELMTQVEELKSKIVELSGEPATEGLKYNPEGSNFNSTIDLKKLSTKERAAYYINNK